MPTKAELQSSLTQRGISFHPSMKKDELERRLEASVYKPTEMTREQARSLTVATLKEILTIHGTSTKGLGKKEALVDAVVQLNPNAVVQEQQKAVETTQKFKEVPTDALRLAMERLSIPDQMRSSIAFNNKTFIKEIQDKRIDIPTKVTIRNYIKEILREHTFTNDMTKDQIQTMLGNSLKTNYLWEMENNYVTVERSLIQNYGRFNYRAVFKIIPKIAKANTLLEIYHLVENENIIEKVYMVSYNILDIEKIKEDMDYIRIGLKWINTYAKITNVKPSQKENITLRLKGTGAPNLSTDPLLYGKYVKLSTKELKR